MNAISVRFCVGCGYLCDEIHPEGGQPLWIDGHTYVMKYGVCWSDLDRRDDACPNCARVLAILHDPVPIPLLKAVICAVYATGF